MTEFERALSDIIFSETSSDELSVERVVDLASKIAPNILQAAREQIVSEINTNEIYKNKRDGLRHHRNEVVVFMIGYKEGIEDTLKTIKEGGK